VLKGLTIQQNEDLSKVKLF